MTKVNKSFNNLANSIKNFKLSRAPLSEKELESNLEQFLKENNFTLTRQEISKLGRSDLTIKLDNHKFCIELKLYATKQFVRQLDTYSRLYDGIILVCWKSSNQMKKVFEIEKPKAKIPIELIEVRAGANIF